MGSLPVLNSLKQFQVQAQCCYSDFEVMIAIHLKKQKDYTATVSWTSVSYAWFLMLCHHSAQQLQSAAITGDFLSYGGGIKKNDTIQVMSWYEAMT